MENDDDISPASRPTREVFTWSNKEKPDRITIEDQTAKFVKLGNWDFIRTEEEHTSGSHKLEIEVDLRDASDKDISFGIAYTDNMSPSKGMYYFQDSCIFASYYPQFTVNYSAQTSIKTPVKTDLNQTYTLAINFDLDSKKVSWEINGEQYDEYDFAYNGKPAFVVLAMYAGTASIL